MQRGSNRTVALLLAILVALGACFSAAPTAGAAPGTPRSCAVSRAKPARDYPAWLAAPGEALVTVGGVNLRAGPSTDCPVIGTLGFGMQVRIANEMLAYDGQLWRKVETTLGEGYTIATAYQGMPEIAPAFVPVLMYHHIDERGGRYSVHPEVFAAQLAWLRDNGYVSITPRDLHNARYNGMPLPARPVMLTIDDGAPSTVTFKALLDQHGFRGVYFLPNFTTLTADQIRELAHSGEVCGHTVTHHRWTGSTMPVSTPRSRTTRPGSKGSSAVRCRASPIPSASTTTSPGRLSPTPGTRRRSTPGAARRSSLAMRILITCSARRSMGTTISTRSSVLCTATAEGKLLADGGRSGQAPATR